jgi:hypothetical protein
VFNYHGPNTTNGWVARVRNNLSGNTTICVTAQVVCCQLATPIMARVQQWLNW